MKLTKRIERVLISFCFFFFFLRIFDAFIIFFFFSSRRRHTRLTCDWSSDVCSSDLALGSSRRESRAHSCAAADRGCRRARSEERRVGKSVDRGGRRIIRKKNRKR